MPRFAHFNHAVAAPAPVLGWYDTDFADYPNLPGLADLLELSDDQWTARLAGMWAVSNNALVPYTPPPPDAPVPASITNFQARAILFSLPNPNAPGTMLTVVNDAIAATGGLAEIAWNCGQPLYRHGALLTKVAATLGANDARIDQLFIAAAQITI